MLHITSSRETSVNDKSLVMFVLYTGHQYVFSHVSGLMGFFQEEEDENFLAIGRAMEEIVDDPVDCYWLIRCFINQFKLKFGDSIPHLVHVYLLKEQLTTFLLLFIHLFFTLINNNSLLLLLFIIINVSDFLCSITLQIYNHRKISNTYYYFCNVVVSFLMIINVDLFKCSIILLIF